MSVKLIAALGVITMLAACGERAPGTSDLSHDDSDPTGGSSGMMVYTDNLTGCQYLGHDSLTPRMGNDGKQICIGPRHTISTPGQ